MKISNNALNFLLAQYRAIFKRAYIKGIASAVILTACLAAGQAQATPTAQDPIWTNDGSDWTIQSGGTAITASGSIVAGDYDNGTDADHNDGSVSGATLVIGASGTPINGDVTSITSGNAFAGYVELGEGSKLDAVAKNNILTVTSGATINTSGGNLVGGWAKTNGSGVAIARDNKLIINNATGGITLTDANQFIGGVAAGNNGATAEGNLLQFTGSGSGVTGSGTALTNNGNYGATVFVGDGTHSGSTGVFEALGNTLDMSHFNITSDSGTLAEKSFIGGNIQVLNVEADNTIELIRSQGNNVILDDFTLGSGTVQSSYGVAQITANNVVNDKGYVALVEANGSGDTGVTLTNGNIYGSFIRGGFAQNVSGGSASANSNIVTITDTNLLNATSGSTVHSNLIVGGHAESTVTSGGQKVNLTASNNAISFQNEAEDITRTKYQVQGTIRGAELVLKSGAAGISDFVGSTLTADNNSITVGAGVDVSAGSINGVYLDTDSKNVASGGATLHASNNTVTLNGNWTSSKDANIATVIAENGLMTAEGNKLVINGEVDGNGGAFVAAVIASEQHEISNKIGSGTTVPNVHQLSNNSVEIGASAVINDAKIYAAQSTKTKAYTLNNDVTIAGTVTNSDIYGGTGADSLVDVQAGSRLTYSDGTSTDPDSGKHTISSDNVDLGGVISVGQYDTLSIKGFANDGNNNAGKYNTNLTNIESTAELYNRGTVELLGDTTVATGAKLHALVDGATIKVNGDSNDSVISGTNTLGVEFVGGRGQLTISKAQLQSYLTAGDNYTLDNTSGTDKAGTAEITSGGVLEFSDSNIDLATLDYSNKDEAGKIYVATDSGSAILKGESVTVSHALASNGTKFADGTYTLNKDGEFGDDYGTLSGAMIDTTGVSIEANDLILGSSRINAEQSEDIKFAKATAKDSINFTVGSGTFTLASKVAGNNYMHTNDLQSDLQYFTALNGTITGDVDVVSGGEISIEYGHWTAQGDIELVAGNTSGGALNVGIANTESDAGRSYISNPTGAALPDATCSEHCR